MPASEPGRPPAGPSRGRHDRVGQREQRQASARSGTAPPRRGRAGRRRAAPRPSAGARATCRGGRDPGQPDHAPDDRRHQPLGGHVQVAVGLGDHAGGEPGDRAAEQRRRPVEPERAGEQQVPAGGGGGQVDRRRAAANETATPNSTVTGAMSTPCRMCEALLIRLTPSGALSRSVTREKSPVQNSTPWARNHSIRAWSLTLSAIARVAGSGHSPWVSQSGEAQVDQADGDVERRRASRHHRAEPPAGAAAASRRRPVGARAPAALAARWSGARRPRQRPVGGLCCSRALPYRPPATPR